MAIIDHSTITKQQLLDFMNNNGFDKCPTCGHNESELACDEDLTTIPLFFNDPSIHYIPGMKIKAVPCFAVTCTKCGHLRLHHKQMVINWLANHE